MKRLKLPHMIFISALSLLMLVSLLMAAYKGPVSAQSVDFNAYLGATIPSSYIDGTIGPEWEDAGEYVDVALDPMMPPYGVADIWTKHDGINLYIAVRFYADSNNPWLAIMFSPWGSVCKGDDIVLFGNDNLSPNGYSDAYFVEIETVPADTDQSPSGTQDGVGAMALGEGNLITIELKKPLDSGDWRGLDISWHVGETQRIVIAWDSDGLPVTAPNSGGSSGGSASHRKATYRERGIFIDPGRKPGFVPSLFATITANKTMPSSITSNVTVQVTELGLDSYGPSEAFVNLTSDKGSFSPSSGNSDPNGHFISPFTAPNVNESTSVEIAAVTKKSGFTDGIGYMDIRVLPLDTRPLSVEVEAKPDSIESGGFSTITVNVTDGFDFSPVPDVTITLSSDSGGSFSPESGDTNTSGIFTSTFTAPNVTQQTAVTITANATKIKYEAPDPSKQTQVTVKPLMEDGIELLWILIGISAISIVVIVVFVARRGKRDKTYEKMRKYYEEVARVM